MHPSKTISCRSGNPDSEFQWLKRAKGWAAGLLLLVSATAGAQVVVNGSVGGQIAPGVYGRVDIGSAPPPPVIYAQPMIIAPPAVAVPAAPVYMYVPPGHAKNWRKHCYRYGACGQRVYFLKNPPRHHYHRPPPPPPPHWRHHDRDRWDDDDRRHRGRDGDRHHRRDRDHDRGHRRHHHDRD